MKTDIEVFQEAIEDMKCAKCGLMPDVHLDFNVCFPWEPKKEQGK